MSESRCVAFTLKGERCKNKALPGKDKCRIHANPPNKRPTWKDIRDGASATLAVVKIIEILGAVFGLMLKAQAPAEVKSANDLLLSIANEIDHEDVRPILKQIAETVEEARNDRTSARARVRAMENELEQLRKGSGGQSRRYAKKKAAIRKKKTKKRTGDESA